MDQGISVTISNTAAQALWAAMHEDDDLAQSYVEYAICHAITHIVSDMPSTSWNDETYKKLLLSHAALKVQCIEREEEHARRWSSYAEPPF